jgi:hypothetical protein
MLEKCLNYEVLGVPNIVVLDPDFRRQYVFSGRISKAERDKAVH